MKNLTSYLIFSFFLYTSLASFSQKTQLMVNIGHTKSIKGICMSSDGKTIITSASDRKIRVWNVQQEKQIAEYIYNANIIYFPVALSADNNYLLSGSNGGSLINLSTGEEINLGINNEIRTCTISSDGKYYALGGESLYLAESATQSLSGKLSGFPSPITSLTFSSSGKLIACGGYYGEIRIFNTETGEFQTNFEKFREQVNALVFSKDENTLYSAGEDSVVRVWDAATGSLLKTIKGQNERIISLALSEDGARLYATGSFQIITWDLYSFNPLKITANNFVNFCSVLSKDEKIIATGANNSLIRIWNTEDGTIIKSFGNNQSSASALDISSDGKSIVVGTDLGEVVVWDSKTLKHGRRWTEKYPILFCNYEFKNQYISTVNSDGKASVYDLLSGKILVENSYSKNKIILSSDGKTTASFIFSTIYLSPLYFVPEPLAMGLEEERGTISDLIFTADNKNILSVTDYNEPKIRLWDVASLQNLKSYNAGYGSIITTLALSPDESQFAAGKQQGGILLFSMKSEEPERSISTPSGISKCIYSPNGKILFAGSQSGEIYLIETATGILSKALSGHVDKIKTLKVYTAQNKLISFSEDQTMKIWDISTGACNATLYFFSDGNEILIVTPEGKYDATPGALKQLYYVKGKEIISSDKSSVNQRTPGLLGGILAL